MKKLKLELDNLQVESFDTSPEYHGAGTVQAHDTLPVPRCDLDPYPGPPLVKTFGPACNPAPTSPHTCGLQSCGFGTYCISYESCAVSCPGGASCQAICYESRVVCQPETRGNCTTLPD